MRQHRGFLFTIVALLATTPFFGQTWQSGTSGTAETLNAAWFVDSQRGWLVGNAGTFRVTTDGGQSWTPIQLTNEDLQDVAFRNAALGLVVGDNGRIFRTVNGTNWTPVDSGTDANLATVAFGGNGLVWAAGRDGVILRSTNDGANWSVLEVGADRYRGAIARGVRAWIVGEGGVIRATADGGASWVNQLSGTTSDLKGVSFVSETEGFVAGQNDTLLYTADGGASWTPRDAGIVQGLDSVYFGNGSIGWAVGSAGVVYATTNGGVSWTPEASGTAQPLGNVFFADAFHGVAVGDVGALVLRTVLTSTVGVERDTIGWAAVPGATAYDIVEGDLLSLRNGGGNFAVATLRCLADDVTATSHPLDGSPAPGEAWWFSVRSIAPDRPGSYDSGSFGQAGTRDGGIAASGAGCP